MKAPMTWRAAFRRLAESAGTVTVYFVSAVPAVIMLTGLVVDGGGQIRASQRANDIAAETARYAAQSIDVGCATLGSNYAINRGAARLSAERFIEQSPEGAVLQDVSFEGDYTMRVTTEVTYEPVFLSIIGVGPQQLDGQAQAYSRRTDVTGEEFDPVGSQQRCQSW